MSATQDFVALDWIKGEISQTLDQAQQALEAVAQSADDSSSMRACLTSLHQVHGTLRMVELEGPTSLSAEMEELAQALMNSEVPDVGGAQEVLMQAILQMPGYLDRIQREQKDSPGFIRPVINSLRLARGLERLPAADGETAPAAGDELALLETPASDEVIAAFNKLNGAANAKKLRARYQQCLVALLKRNNPRENLSVLGKVFTMLVRVCGDSPIGNLCLLALAVVEGIASGAIRLDSALATSLRGLDGELKRLAEEGDAVLSRPASRELGEKLLSAVQGASKDTPRIVAARKKFVGTAAPQVQEEEKVSFGPDDETLAAVARILIEELAGITDKLDLYVRSNSPSTQALIDLLPQLEQIKGTLSVVGLADHQASVTEQIEVIKGLEATGNKPSEDVLLDIAKAFLQIESYLKSVVGDSDDGDEGFGDLSEAEASVIKETRNGLAQCKDAVIEYVSSDFNREKVESLPGVLRGLRGGLLIINQSRSADVLAACAAFAEAELVSGDETPALTAMDDLADAITSIDYFLERYLENPREPYLQMVEVAETAISKLGYVPGHLPEPVPAPQPSVPSEDVSEEVAEEDELATALDEAEPEAEPEVEEAPVESPAAELEPEQAEPEEEAADLALDDLELEPDEEVPTLEEQATEAESLEPEPGPDAEEPAMEEAAPEAPAAGDDLVDDEILEIFIEEAEEVLETINEFFPRWQADQNDNEALTEVRRAFHTLKGSGRMVGATVIGELAWSVENMLNRVIDKSIDVSGELLAVVADVIGRIPEGIEHFKQGNQDGFRADELAARADALAAGDATAGAVDDTTIVEEVEFDESLFEDRTEAEASVEESEDEGLSVEDLAPAESFELDELEEEAGTTVDDEATEAPAESFEPEDDEAAPSEESEPAESLDDLSLDDLEVPEESHDEELDEIFLAEAEERMATVRAYVEAPGNVTPDLVAAFHTLKGSAGMADVPAVSQIAAPLEKLASQLLNNVGDKGQFDELAAAGATLIEAILSDLAGRRNDIDGLDALVARAEAQLQAFEADAARQTFDFANVRLLSTPDEVIGAWDESQINDLVEELRQVIAQASEIGHVELQDLAEALLGVYNQLSARPTPEIADTLARAHEHLVHMFDHIAASQDVVPVPGLVEELLALDLSAAPEAEATPSPATEAPSAEVPPAAAPAGETMRLPEDEIDEDVLPLFLEEAEELLENIDQAILDWSNDTTSDEYLDDLLRHLHTLKGGARLAGMNSLGEYTHNFETFLIDFRQHPVDMDDAFFALLNDRQDEITRRVGIYTKLANGQASDEELASMQTATLGGAGTSAAAPVAEPQPEPQTPEPAVSEAPAAQPQALATSAPTETELPADEVDEDILPVFLEEAEELVESIDQSILDWSNEPANHEPLDNLLRHLHTLKGGSRLAGLASLGEYTHNFETFLIGVQQNPVGLDDAFFALVNQRQDEINRRVGIYRKLAAGEATEEELASMRTAIEPGAQAPAGTSAEPPAAPPATAEAPASPEATPAKADAGQTKPGQAAQAQQEMVRVSSDLLEDLISMAGESSITRGRIQQQIIDFGEALEEMEETIERIREQVRRLEIEAESRETVFRTRQREEKEELSAFDELEMDRYTMLQQISRALSEGSSDMMDLKDTLVNKARDAETLLHQQARIGSELQEGLTRTRMVPFARLIPRLRRIVRQISNEVGKSVRFDAYNVEGELDRNVLERIVAPLEHMLRNAVDHGIESAEDRKAAGKPEQGRISLRVSREGGYVVLTVSDDGAGINIERVRAKAIERGLITADSDVSEHEIRQFIMSAGFSTAQQVTQISGRGVGMDVVASEIKQLGGNITIDSTLGVGTEFTIQLPFTVSINRALMVVVQDETYAVPLNTIEGIYRVSPYELDAYYQPDAPMFEAAGQPYRLVYMGKLLNEAADPNLEGQVVPLPVILARSGNNAVAFQVDRVIGSREVVVKSLGPQFNEVSGVSGATVMGDGSVVIILDLMSLVRNADVRAADVPPVEEAQPESRVRTVMIVDDSVTVRKVTSRLMERQGWEVMTAKDGVDAMGQLQEAYPDIVLLDIEMPRMDGFEVLRSVRRDERLKDLPIIMITSRTGEKHQQQALELGVNRYLGKPFQEANLLSTIDEVLQEVRAKS